MTEHLGYAKHATEGRGTGNSRNGKSTKRIKTGTGEVEIAVPRDREGDFDPQFVRGCSANRMPQERMARLGTLTGRRRCA